MSAFLHGASLSDSNILLRPLRRIRAFAHGLWLSWSYCRPEEGTHVHPTSLFSHFTISQTHDGQAPWSQPPPVELPIATKVTILQLAHVCALLGVINGFVLRACRRHLAFSPALQENIVFALMVPLVIGDVLHIAITLCGLGDTRWDVRSWSPLLWVTVLLGLTLFIPRVMWHMGIWRYVHKRDGQAMDTVKER